MGLFNAEDFLSLCLTYSNFVDLIAQMLTRLLTAFGITVPGIAPACRQIYDTFVP